VTKQRNTAADTAADALRTRILGGDLAPGDLLPGERDLSEQLGVSRLTLRSSLARLEAEGLVQSSQGTPTRVLDYRHSAGIDIIEYLARLEHDEDTIPLALFADLLELRRLVAVEMICLVAERASDDELAEARAALDALIAAKGAPEAFMQADLAFARTLVRASHNLAVELLYNTILRVIATSDALRPAFHVNADATLASYEALLTLLGTADPVLVRDPTREALEALDRDTLARLAETASTNDERNQERGR
jgi:GntR family transcriptional repressor for pyruvate dehydrogenase complex